MREVAGLGQRALSDPLALIEQRVQVVDQRLNLGRVRPSKLLISTAVDIAEPRSQLADRRYPSADLPRAHCEAHQSDDRYDADMRKRFVHHTRRVRIPQHELRERERHNDEKTQRPEDRAEQHARAQR